MQDEDTLEDLLYVCAVDIEDKAELLYILHTTTHSHSESTTKMMQMQV